jgi:hypothetical protein
MPTMKEQDTCPICEKGILEFVKGNEPYDTDHLQCSYCDSTFILTE